MRKFLLILFVGIVSTVAANALPGVTVTPSTYPSGESIIFRMIAPSAQLAATATVSPSVCPATGVITVNASGGTSPYQYALSGTVIRSPQASNVFSALPVGTYAVTVTDNVGGAVTVSNLVVNSTYVNMNPTATAITEQCGGSNTGSIKLSFSSGQGIPPYTYQVVSGTTIPAPSTTTTTSYTFQNLAPGSYRVSVTDACTQTQARDASLSAGPTHTSDVYGVWAYTSSDCTTTDYYIQPGLGTYFPHTYYAYPNGDTNQTPYTITFNDASSMVPVPYINRGNGFKWTLPTPNPWLGGKYTFKHTDICNPDVNSTSVTSKTNILGDYQVTTSIQNCVPTLTVKVFNGWELNASLTSSVTVSITSQTDGSTVTQTITDPNIRSTTFNNVKSGVTYNVVIADACPPRKITTTQTVGFNMGINKYPGCAANIDGMTGYSWSFNNGWQSPVTATFVSGPTSYYSALYNQTFTTTYPITLQPYSNGMIYASNIAPGTYTVVFTDGCSTVTNTLNIPATNYLTSYTFPAIKTGGCPGSQTFTLSASSTCQGINANIRLSPNTVIGNGASMPWTQTNVITGATYIVYYYAAKRTNEIFANTNTYESNSVLLKTDSVVIPYLSSQPSVTTSGFAQCSSGSMQVSLYKTSTSPDIATYTIEKNAGQGDFYAPQASNVFTIANYGLHAYKVTDVCGNAGTGFIDVEPPTFFTSAPATICSGDKFAASFSPVPSDGIISWSNSLGETGTGTISETLTNTTSGPITVTYDLKATYTSGCSSSNQSMTVTVNPVPEITPSVTSQTICSGEKAVMNFTSSLPGTTFSWTADDGTSGTGNISEIKTNTGTTSATITYTITGQTTEGCKSQSQISRVTVYPAVALPTASVTTQPNCAVSTGIITVTAPTGTGYAYSIDGMNYQTGTTFSNLFAGTYSLTVKNSDGCTSAAMSLTVNTQPVTPPVATASVTTQPNCAVSTGIITVTAPTGTDYAYSVDGMNYQSSTTFSVLTPGVYNVTVKNSDGCTSAGVPLTISSQPLTPAVPILSAVTQPTCSSSTGSFEITNYDSSFTYTISPSSGVNMSGNSITAPAGTYQVTATLSSCTSAASANITVNTQPPVPSAAIAPIGPLCVNSEPVQVSATPVGGIFSGAGINIAGLFSPSVAGVGSHAITYTYTNPYGCSVVAMGAVQVVSAPDLSINPSTQTINSGGQASVTVSGDNGGVVSWSSDYYGLSGTGTTFNTGVIFNKGSSPLVFTLNASVNDGSCFSKASAVVTVNPEPQVIVNPRSAAVCSYEIPHFTLRSVLSGTVINWQLVNNANSSVVSSGSGIDSIVLFAPPLAPGSYTLQVSGTKDGYTSALTNVSLTVN